VRLDKEKPLGRRQSDDDTEYIIYQKTEQGSLESFPRVESAETKFRVRDVKINNKDSALNISFGKGDWSSKDGTTKIKGVRI
jgi:hypothetical protein